MKIFTQNANGLIWTKTETFCSTNTGKWSQLGTKRRKKTKQNELKTFFFYIYMLKESTLTNQSSIYI